VKERGSIPTLSSRANVAARFADAISIRGNLWGFRKTSCHCCPADRSAFVQEGQRTVAHGGVTLEEAIGGRSFGSWEKGLSDRQRMIGYNRTVKLVGWMSTVDPVPLAGYVRTPDIYGSACVSV